MDVINYDYYKVVIGAFLKSLENKPCKVMMKGHKHPMITSKDDTTTIKLEVDWTDVEDDEALGNSKAFNAIFNGVDKNMFRLIKKCSEAK